MKCKLDYRNYKDVVNCSKESGRLFNRIGFVMIVKRKQRTDQSDQ